MKKRISILLVICMLFSISILSIPVNAQGSEFVGASDEDVPFDLDAEIEKIMNDARYTDKQKEIFVDKLLGKKLNLPIRKSQIYLAPYNQEYNWSCGAAVARTTLKYITGNDPGEAAMRNYMGITQNASPTIEQVRSCLNAKQSRNSYSVVTVTSASQLTSAVESCVYSFNCPAVLLIATNTTGLTNTFGYSSKGHFVNATGRIGTSYGYNIKIADPYRSWKGLTPTYEVNANTVYDAIRQHAQKKMAW